MSRSAKGLPEALRRRDDFTDTHALHALPEHVTVDRVAIAEELGRGGVVREGVHDLLGRPGSGGMFGDIEVEDAPAVVGEHGSSGRRCAQRRQFPASAVRRGFEARPREDWPEPFVRREPLIWRLTRGRPATARAESVAQYSRKRRRCPRRTVLGDTMTRACLQPAHTLDNATQNSRSLPSNFSRVTIFL
jgi:hypothetical protein